MNAVSHVAHSVYRRHFKYVSLVVGEVRVGLDGCCDVLKLSSVLKFYVNHTAVQALTLRYSHRKSVLHTLL